MNTFNILAIDGGGIRGALSTRILLRICEEYPDFLNSIDLFSGTSTGAIIALALASGKDCKYIDSLYDYKTSKYIFGHNRINLFRPKYSNNNLKRELSKHFPENLKIKDLKKYAFIPTFNIKGHNSPNWEPVFINNLTSNNTDKFTVLDSALASSAAPTFFPAHKYFIDGGVVASSPSALAAFYTLSKLKTIPSSRNIRILSIGTGDSPDNITIKNLSWGAIQWTFTPFRKVKSPLLSIMLEGSSLVDNLYCSEIFKNNYFRINPTLDFHIGMDQYKHVDYLKDLADNLNLDDLFKFVETKLLKTKDNLQSQVQ